MNSTKRPLVKSVSTKLKKRAAKVVNPQPGHPIDGTERKKADEAWKASEKRYRRLFESAKDGILILNAETGVVIDVNPFLITMLGFPKGEICGKELWELGFFKDINESKAHFKELKQNKYIRYKDLPLETAGGRKFRMEFVSNVYQEDHVKVIQCNIRDITEYKRTEDALRESEKHYHSLFENMLEGYAYCQMLFTNEKPFDFIYLDVNRAFEELTGLRNVIGKKVSDVIPGIQESNPEIFKVYSKVALTGKSERFETYIESMKIWLSISVYSTRKEYFVAVFDNITNRKRTEQAMLDSEARYRAIYEGASIGIAFGNLDGHFVDINPSLQRILGYSLEELSGKTMAEITHPDDLAMDFGLFRETVEGLRQGYQIEKRYFHKDGHIIWGNSHIAVVLDASGLLTLSASAFLRLIALSMTILLRSVDFESRLATVQRSFFKPRSSSSVGVKCIIDY